MKTHYTMKQHDNLTDEEKILEDKKLVKEIYNTLQKKITLEEWKIMLSKA